MAVNALAKPTMIDLPDGIIFVIAFACHETSWVRIDFKVRVGCRSLLRAVTCCGPDDLSPQIEASDDEDDNSDCEDCQWLTPHTVQAHAREMQRPRP